ncbi:MAG: hypothetical protein ACJ740_14435 [Gaiellales bacterium]
MTRARLYLLNAMVCFLVGVAIQAVWPDSDLAYSLSVALLIGLFLFIIAAYIDLVRGVRRRR